MAPAPVAAAPVASAAAPGSTGANAGRYHERLQPADLGHRRCATGVGGVAQLLTGGLLQTQQADLSGVHAAQNADYGEARVPRARALRLHLRRCPEVRPRDHQHREQRLRPARQGQQDAAQGLGSPPRRAGAVPRAAELQLRQQSAKNQAANLGAARALGGRSAGGVARAATLANAGANAETNLDAAQTRAQEQAAARQQQIQALSGVAAGQDASERQRAGAASPRRAHPTISPLRPRPTRRPRRSGKRSCKRS